jgi:hypothetical protein
MKYIMSRKYLILITIFISTMCCSTLIHSLDVPDEALEVAETYLKLRGLNATLGEPYPSYVMSSQDLLRITDEESSLITNAIFVCYDFPYLINGKPRGMISVRNNGEEWQYYKSSGQEPLYNIIHDLRKKRPESDISLLSIDSHRFFAVVVMEDKTFLIPKNSHTQDLFKGTIYEDEEFPWISYSIACSVLRGYASSDIDKGCIKHEE